MRRSRDRSNWPQLVLEVPETHCSECGRRLVVRGQRTRPLQTLKSRQRVVLKDKGCPSADCSKSGEVLRPPAEAALPVLAGSEYGIDVVSWIGWQRSSGSKSLPECHQVLVGENEVQISARHVSNLFRVYLALVHCVNADEDGMRARLRAQGRLILSVDGVHFDGTSPVLYVVRDLISKEVLYSERVTNRDAEHLAEMLRKVKALDIPVAAIISDKERSLVPAIAEVFPDVPHQFCQAHFLMNVAKPMEAELAEVGALVSNIVKEVKTLERELPDHARSAGSSPAEVRLVEELCKAARTGGQVSGDPLLNPSYLRRYERLEMVLETAKKASRAPGKRGRDLVLLTMLMSILTGLLKEAELVRRLALQVEVVRKFAHFLNFYHSSSQIRRLFRTYLNQLARSAPVRGKGAARGDFIRNAIEIADRYWLGLFHAYDVPGLPKNNNELEQTFSAVKRKERKATGRKTTSGGPLESCAEFVLEAWSTAEVQRDLLKELHHVPRERFLEAMVKIRELADPARERRSIQRKPEAHLESTLNTWFGS